MGDLTEHFNFMEMVKTNHSEFQLENIKQGEQYIPKFKDICDNLEKIRNFVCRPIIINSGFRCPVLNKAVGGSPSSQHMIGEAVDFTVKDFDDFNGLKFIFYWAGNHCNYGQLILENPPNSRPWVHFGLPRPNREKTRYLFQDGKYTPI